MIASLWILGFTAWIGMSMLFGPWKGLCYLIWTIATLAFWWGAAVICTSLVS
jgi:hypothetical protein